MLNKLLLCPADILFGIVVLSCLWMWQQPVDTTVHYNLRLEKRVDSMSVLLFQAKEHNENLLHNIADQKAVSMTILGAIDNARIQSRLFYSVIIAAILTIMFTVTREHRSSVAVIALLVIGSMYLLEISLSDQFIRQIAKGGVITSAEEKFLNMPPKDSTWYTLDNVSLDSAATSASQRQDRRVRKLQLALQPNLEQLIYYALPFVLIFLLQARAPLNRSMRDCARRITPLKRKKSTG